MTKVLVVDDSPSMRAVLCRMLETMNLVPVEADCGERAIELYPKENPGIVLLDVNMPGIDGYETARQLRALTPDDWTPIIFLSANEADQDYSKAIESGGDDYLIKPVGRIVLLAKIRALQRLDEMRRKLQEMSTELAASNRRLEQLSQRDGLTGVANRRYFDDFLTQHISLATRQKTKLALALCDVDSFKMYNDNYGHLAGDECLRKVATVLARCCRRASDLVARYGGEEFAIVMPDTDVAGAAALMEKVRQALAAMAIDHPKNLAAVKTVSLSIGVTEFRHGQDQRPEDMIARSDAGLYQAKEAGRDRIVSN
ncbi:MAG TPA: diguanylate cyclase [Burkholderiales bacterium]|nr:diguanylate cyclase [Burkholderiales bacterium]